MVLRDSVISTLWLITYVASSLIKHRLHKIWVHYTFHLDQIGLILLKEQFLTWLELMWNNTSDCASIVHFCVTPHMSAFVLDSSRPAHVFNKRACAFDDILFKEAPNDHNQLD